ncbi:phage integrase N-terminal SAM-like domain-containing protein, partial [Xanthovirga aplysinae]|uniref:phage integrase N-terminal SAM-like domain-containing protein n=1 Tax=Xanthovirga aplysinae TaxID=2529853 RepID=UPI0016576400
MKDPTKHITLKHLLINGQKKIGIQFYPDKIIQALIKELPTPKWSRKYGMVYIENTATNLKIVFERFRGVAWVNTKYFFKNSTLKNNNKPLSIEWFRQRKLPEHHKVCPEAYFLKLEIKKYSLSTAKSYISHFEAYMNYFKTNELLKLNENDIRSYLGHLVKVNKSEAYIHQAINSIKFYYEMVLEMPNRFYAIERPRKKVKLPIVLSQKEVSGMLNNLPNIKHKCILGL